MPTDTVEKTDEVLDTAKQQGQDKTNPLDFDDPMRTAEQEVPAKKESAGEGADAEAEGEVEFDPELLARAKRSGLNMTDVTEIGSPEGLTKVLDALDAHAETEARGNNKPPRKSELSADDPKAQLKLDLDPEVLGQPVVDLINKITSHYDDQTKTLKAEIASLRSAAEDGISAARDDRINGYFEEMTDFQDIIGDSHPRNRKKVTDEMSLQRAGYEATGRKAPAERELFKKAFAAVFGDEQAVVARKKLTGQLQKRESTFTARPDTRGTQLSEKQRAMKVIQQFVEQHPVPDYADEK